MEIWKECVGLALQLFNGTFKSTIGNRNSYMNPDKASQIAKTQWGDKLDLEVGSHKFGYLKEHDPKYVIPGTMTPLPKKDLEKGKYKIQKGDSLSVIAKRFNMSLKELLEKNP